MPPWRCATRASNPAVGRKQGRWRAVAPRRPTGYQTRRAALPAPDDPPHVPDAGGVRLGLLEDAPGPPRPGAAAAAVPGDPGDAAGGRPLMVDAVVLGERPSVDLKPFRYDRFDGLDRAGRQDLAGSSAGRPLVPT